ncbi:hypothetical protein GCM10010407_01500 [Rarobacter incanus]
MASAGIRSGRTASRSYRVFGSGPLPDAISAQLGVLNARGEQGRAGLVAIVVIESGSPHATGAARSLARLEALTVDAEHAIQAAGGGGHVIVVSSAAVCGAWPQRPDITDADLAVMQGDLGWVGTAAAGESLVKELVASGNHADPDRLPRLTVVRTAPLVGQDIDTAMTRNFGAPRLLRSAQHTKRWQFLHVRDLVSALVVVGESGLCGTVVAGAARESAGGWEPDTESTETVARIAGRRTLSLSDKAAASIALRLDRAGMLPGPVSDLAFTLDSWVVMPSKLLHAGWRPQVSTAECVRSVVGALANHPGVGSKLLAGRGAIAAGAVGAAVAAAGTIMAVRRSKGVT